MSTQDVDTITLPGPVLLALVAVYHFQRKRGVEFLTQDALRYVPRGDQRPTPVPTGEPEPEDGPVDGGGLPLPEHAKALAAALELTEGQVTILVAELRNALVPAQYWAEREGVDKALQGIDRILALAFALTVRHK